MSYLSAEIEQAWQDTLDYYGALYGLIFAPTVSTFSPADGASSIAVDNNIIVTFSEAITNGTGIIEVLAGSATGTVFETFDVASSSRLIFSGRTLTIDPTNSLADGTNYFVTLASGSIKDMAGNSYTGTSTYNFTTISPDTTETVSTFADYTAQITAIYLAYYGRPADVIGLAYWNSALITASGDLAAIINAFGTSDEATSLYSSSSNVAKINSIYLALFNRSADAGGLIYYAGLLDNGTKSQASIALDILNGATGDDLTLITKKLLVSADFTAAMQADATAMIAYAGTTAATTARTMLSAVTADSDDSGVVETTLISIITIGGYLVEWDGGISISSVADETFIGDSDINIVVFSDFRANYTLTETDTGWLISSTTDGNDTINNVERLQFTDLSLALDTDAANSAGGIYRLYKAALDRDPDLGGLGYWIAQADAGTKDAVQMATDFTYADEFKTLYGVQTVDNYMTGEDITALVTQIYENVLNRAPDLGGRDYYAGQITTKSKTVGQVLAEISDSAENKLAVADLIGTGIEYTPWFG